MGKKGLNRKVIIDHSFCFLYVMIASTCDQLNKRKKGCDRVPFLFLFLRTPLFSIYIWSKFSCKRKAWPLMAVRLPPPTTPLVTDLINTHFLYLLWVSVISYALLMNTWWEWGRIESAILHSLCIFPAHAHVPLSFLVSHKKHEFENKIKNLKLAKVEH